MDSVSSSQQTIILTPTELARRKVPPNQEEEDEDEEDDEDDDDDDDDENGTSLPYPCAPVPQLHSAPLKKRLVGENCAAASLAALDILAKLWSSELQAQILSEIFVAASSFDLVGKLGV